MPLQVLVVSSETAEQQEARRSCTGAASHDSYAATLRRLRPGIGIAFASCVAGPDPLTAAELRSFDGIFFPGSPIQMHEASAETRAAAGFMARVFEAGTPAFGSCAGLQIAAVAAGGVTGPREDGTEAAFARNITMTEAGRTHPMLRGRPAVWMAPAMHSSMVTALPPGATLLARNASTAVEAAEIRHGNGVFWGVQYHPELSLGEIGASLRRQASELVDQRLGRDEAAIGTHAGRLEALDRDPGRRDLAWQLGLDDEVTEVGRRTREIRNFLGRIEGASGPAR